jgi:ribonucleoside-diphosphate reductase alpha chain
MEHLDTLEVVAKWVSTSCSKTVNMPQSTTKEQISEVYLSAWKRGIIGVTVYRDKCRDQILSSSIDETTPQLPNKLVQTNAPKRPEKQHADLHHIKVGNQRFYVAVGLYTEVFDPLFRGEDPFEVFVGENYDSEGEIFIPKNVDKGIIRKDSRSNYTFISDEGKEYKLHNNLTNDTADGLTRAISLGLRHGAAVQYAVEQLEKTKGTTVSFTKAVGRALKKYIKEGAEVSGSECPNCKSKLIREAGCISCPACHWSKCG